MPELLRTHRFRLEELAPRWAEPDYAAFWACRERLRRELDWNGWPPEGFNLEDNRADLKSHHDELLAHEAYAYTVLDPDADECLGCIYIEPWRDQAQLCLWVTDEGRTNGFEAHLLDAVLRWLHEVWRFRDVLLPLRPQNEVGRALAAERALPHDEEIPAGYLGYLSGPLRQALPVGD